MTDDMVMRSIQSRFRRLPRWAWVLIGVIVLLFILVLWWLSRRPTVTVAPVTRGQAVAAVYAPGTVLSGTRTVIAATAAGRITMLAVARGSAVIPGQLVASIDDAQARLQLEQARRELTTARAQLTQVSEPGDPYAVQQARAQLTQAQADYRRALEAVTAARAEVRSARARVEQEQAAVQTALARVTTARRNVEAQQRQRDVARDQVASVQAQVASAEAAVDNARDALARQEALFAEGAVSERRVVEARTAVRTAEAGLAQARANVQAARQQVNQADAGVEAAQAGVVAAESGVDEARAAQAQAESAVNAAEAQLAQTEAQAAAAREQITAAQAQLSQTQRGERSSVVEVARTRVETAQTAVAQAQDALSNYAIRSLVRGTVSDVPVEVGDYVPLGGSIADVVSQQVLYVEADVDEADIGPVRVGQTTYFTTDSVPDRTYQGIVMEIGASANEATNTYPVDIRNIADTTGLRVNLSVDVNIVTAINRNALLVPSSAVILEPTPHLWVVTVNSRLQYRSITIGARDTAGGRISVRSGITGGERVVVDPKETFHDGQRVRVTRR